MKHIIYHTILFFIFLVIPSLVFSQETAGLQLNDTVPFNPDVKRGVLPNGFSYYLSRNISEPGRIYIDLNVKAGCLQQEEDQAEAAHVMEHVAFRSSVHYPPGKDFKEYLKASSIKFNAAPGNKHITFYFTLPADTAIMENICLVFQDWLSGKCSLTDGNLTAEKSIVAEEYIERTKGGVPAAPKAISLMLQPSRVSESYSILATGDYQQKIISVSNAALRRFYNDWYRPDLSGLIVVGDIDIPAIERLVRRLFAGLQNPTVPHSSTTYPMVLTGNNPYITDTRSYGGNKDIRMELFFLKESRPKTTYGDRKSVALEELFNSMMRSRLNDLYKGRKGQTPEQVHGGIGDGLLGHTWLGVRSLSFSSTCENEKNIKACVKALFTESERIQRYGFSEQELANARSELLASLSSAEPESIYEEGRRYSDHFVYKEAAPSWALLRQLQKKFLSEISLEEINQAARGWMTAQNRHIVLWAPGRTERQLPDEATALSWLQAIQQGTLARYEISKKREVRVNFDSLYRIPSPATYTRQDFKGEIVQLHLANGVTVIMKTANPSSGDRIFLESARPVGAGGYADGKYFSMIKAPELVLEAGLGELSKDDLDIYKEEHKVRSGLEMSEQETRITGGAPSEELETLLQLTYRYFLVPRKDSDAYTFKMNSMFQWANQTRNFVSRELSRQAGYRLQMGWAAYSHLSPMEVNTITYDQCLAGYKTFFSNPREFTFALTGVRDVAKTIALVTKYLGNLPVRKENPPPAAVISPKNPNFHIEKTFINKSLRKGEAEVLLIYAGYHLYSERETVKQRILGKVMESILHRRLREKEAGIYSFFSAGMQAQKVPGRDAENWCEFRIKFPCDPAIHERLIRATEEEIELLKKDGPARDDFDSAVRECKQYWLSSELSDGQMTAILLQRYQNKQDLSDLSDRDAAFNSIRPEDIQQAAREYLVKNGYIRYVELPETR